MKHLKHIPPSHFFSSIPSLIEQQQVKGNTQNVLKPSSTFYRRELPQELHAFTSQIGKRLFKESLMNGTAEIYFSLSGNFTMQSEPAFCGLGSLVMVLNALSVDPGKRWKGVWRWFSDEILDCTPPLDHVKHHGLTFHELACLARCNGLSVVTKRADKVCLDEFLSDVKRVCESQNEYMVVSFSRGALNQTGDGHFSPIGAYHEKENQILVMDTARFKYPSYFVNGNQLYQAMLPNDETTNLPRGYLLLSKGNVGMSLVKFKNESWNSLKSIFSLGEFNARKLRTTEDVLSYLLSLFYSQENGFVLEFEKPGLDLAGKGLQNEHLNEITLLCKDIQDQPMFAKVQDYFYSLSSHHINIKSPRLSTNEQCLITLLLLSLPDSLYSQFPNHSRYFIELKNIRSPRIAQQVDRLTQQCDNLLNIYCKCSKQ